METTASRDDFLHEYMHFSTLQTAKLSKARTQIGTPNIIIIDEADIISMAARDEYGDFMETVMSYYQPDEQ